MDGFSRRSFLRGLLSSAAAAVVVPAAVTAIGDGVPLVSIPHPVGVDLTEQNLLKDLTLKISGYDAYGASVTEMITIRKPSGSLTLKRFKTITAIGDPVFTGCVPKGTICDASGVQRRV
jgi:hypothetical protein